MTTVAYDVQVYMTIEICSDSLIFDCASNIIWSQINNMGVPDMTDNDLEITSA